MTSAHLVLAPGEPVYKRLESPGEIEPGDYVYEVVRFGRGAKDVKYNRMRVIDVERQAVKAVHVDGARTQPIKVAFRQLVIRTDATAALDALDEQCRPLEARVQSLEAMLESMGGG